MKQVAIFLGCLCLFTFRLTVSAGMRPSLSAGSFFSAATGPDGSLWVWGGNDRGRLGSGSTDDANRPTVVETSVLFSMVACGDAHAVALSVDGNVYAWGGNNYGQLGIGSVSDSIRPVRVNGVSNAVGVAAGLFHSLAVLSDGTVMGWGRNDQGQISAYMGERMSVPIPVLFLADVTAVDCGVAHSVALTVDGRVMTWGGNEHGQLGYELEHNVLMPREAQGLSNITQIASGDFHSLALDSAGTVFSWGLNRDGQLGRALKDNGSPAPARVAGVSNVLSVWAGSFVSMAVTRDGTLWAWGDNRDGQLGNGDIANTYIPTRVGSVSNVAFAAAGYKHTLILQTDGAFFSCGRNDRGQLGVGSRENSAVPVVSGLSGVWEQIFEWMEPISFVTNAIAGKYYEFSVPAVSSWGDTFEYRFDWGADSVSRWLVSSAVSNSWQKPGTNMVHITARSVSYPFRLFHRDEPFTVVIAPVHEAFVPENPSGPTNLWIESENVFSSEVARICSRGHPAEIQYDWGGTGNYSEWLTSSTVTQVWTEAGLYTVRVRTRCGSDHAVVSEWSGPLPVSVVNHAATRRVYRLQSIGAAESTYGRIWTASEPEAAYLDSLNSWRIESVAWRAYTTNVPDSVPMRRFLSRITGIHHFSCDPAETGVLQNDPAWVDEGVQFYVFKESSPSFVPVYRFYHPELGLHYLTADSAEKEGLVDTPERGYLYEGVVCYVIPAEKEVSAERKAIEQSAPEEDVESEEPDSRRGMWMREIGWPGCIAVPGDYNNNGRAELAVYDPFLGEWVISDDSSLTEWGGFAPGIPVQGDFDGDGIADIAVYEPETGVWHVQGSAVGYQQVEFGWSEAIPLARDYNGDGMTDLGLYYPEEGKWFIWSSSGAYYELQLGDANSVPVPADYDGSGLTDLAVYDPVAGRWHIWTWKSGLFNVEFGGGAAKPVPADYSGDGATDIGVFIPESGMWNIWTISGESYNLQFGWPGVVPVPADYDGDGRADLAVYDPVENRWYVWTW